MIAVRKWAAGRPEVASRWIKFLCLCVGILASHTLLAQNWCDPNQRPPAAETGGFSVRSNKGCAPFTVEITAIANNVTNQQYIYEYTGGDPTRDASVSSQLTKATTHTYTKPGVYRILQVGSGTGTGSIACVDVTVLDVTLPTISVTSCADRNVTVVIKNDSIARQYNDFVISWGDGVAQTFNPGNLGAPLIHQYGDLAARTITVQPRYNNTTCAPAPYTTTITPSKALTKPVISRLATAGNSVTLQIQADSNQTLSVQQKGASGTYVSTPFSRNGSGPITVSNVTAHPTCFKVTTQDGCSQSTESDEVCSINLEVGVDAAKKQNQLKWTALTGQPNFRNYIVSKNSITLSTITSAATNTLDDGADLVCGQQYCYQVTAQAGTALILSDRVCVVAKSNDVPPPFSTVQVSVNDNGLVDLRGILPLPSTQNPIYNMIVLRSDGAGGSFSPVQTVANGNTFQDANVQTSRQSYCYQVVYQNACEVASDASKAVCTIHLASNSGTTIDWTNQPPFSSEAIQQYIIEKRDPGGTLRDEVPVGLNTAYEPNRNDPDIQQFRFRVKAITATGAVSYSNYYNIAFAPNLYLPDAFTPNGDGINDRFELKGSSYFESIRMTVYNRWGNVLFHADDRTGWDGTLNGQPAPAGTYTYRIEATDQTGQKTVKAGSLLLIR